MSRTPEKFVEQVVDRQTFVEFLEILAEDWFYEQETEQLNPSSPYGAGALGWEHGTIGNFIEAAARYARDSSVPPNPNPWRAAAEIILRGKGYE